MDPQTIAGLIDHTILKPDATSADVEKVCAEALRYTFASVCVNPYWVPLVAAKLVNSAVKTCSVVGFPLGATTTSMKIAETREAVRAGAHEIDMVINVGELRGGHFDLVRDDIAGVVEAARSAVPKASPQHAAIVKVILEAALLNDTQKATACLLSKEAGAAFVKTSTGFGPGGATVADVALMRKIVGPAMGVKASGGIRTLEDLKKMVASGATRVGASASVKIMEAAFELG